MFPVCGKYFQIDIFVQFNNKTQRSGFEALVTLHILFESENCLSLMNPGALYSERDRVF